MAFKDLALSLVGQFLEYFLEKRKKHVTVLVGMHLINSSILHLSGINGMAQDNFNYLEEIMIRHLTCEITVKYCQIKTVWLSVWWGDT